MAMRPIASLRELPDKYKGVLLDQFGVVHDGQRPYHAAVAALEYLKSRGLKTFVLSNSSRRSSEGLKKLHKMGIDPALLAGMVTSGDVAYEHLMKRPGPMWEQMGSKVLHITWAERGAIQLDDLQLQVVDSPQEATFILAHGTEGVARSTGGVEARPLEGLKELLTEAAARAVPPPLVVANPDIVTVSGTELLPMPGSLAQHYAALGGPVHLMGKPEGVIYQRALDALNLDPAAVLAVGDSLDHDIKGANQTGIDTLFILGGIHAADVGLQGRQYDQDRLGSLLAKQGAQVTYVQPYLEA